MTNLINMLDTALINEQKRRDESYKKTHHFASGFLMVIDGKLEGRCLRESFYEWFNFKKTNVEAKSLYNFASGSMWEDFICNKLAQEYPDYEQERGRVVMIQPKGLECPIKGKIDVILRRYDQPEKPLPGNPSYHPHTILVEIKTTQGRAFTNRMFGIKYQGPKTGHSMQTSFYHQYCDADPKLYFDELKAEWKELVAEMKKLPLLLRYKQKTDPNYTRIRNKKRWIKGQLNRIPEVKPDETIIWYFSREDFNRLQFGFTENVEPIPMNDFRCFKTTEMYLKKKQLPPRTYKEGIKRYPCSWCFYRDRCYNIDKE